MKKPIVKFMAGALAAAMVVTSPVTVFAENGGIFSSLYSTNKELERTKNTESRMSATGFVDDEGNEYDPVKIFEHVVGNLGTTTISATGSLMGVELGKETPYVIGVGFDQDEVNVIAGGKTAELKAMVYLSDGSVLEGKDLKNLLSFRKIQTSAENQNLKAGNVTYAYDATAGGMKAIKRDTLEIRGIQGGSFIIEARVILKNKENPEAEVEVGETFTARAVVNVKEYASKLTLSTKDGKLVNKDNSDIKVYAKHTYNLNNYLYVESATANDNITWTASAVKKSNNKPVSASSYITLKEDGTLTVKKDFSRDAVITVQAASEKAVKGQTVVSAELAYSEGEVPAKKLVLGSKGKQKETLGWGYLKVSKNKISEFNSNGLSDSMDVTVKVDSVKVADKAGKDTTDKITWTSNKPGVADVVNETNDVNDDAEVSATIVAKSVGTAKITAKASSGASYTFTITVKAPLENITAVNGSDKAIIGQKVTFVPTLKSGMVEDKCKDKVKWEITDVKDASGTSVAENQRSKFAAINGKGVLTTKYNKNNTVTVNNEQVVGGYTVEVRAYSKAATDATDVNSKQGKKEVGATTTIIVEPSQITADKITVKGSIEDGKFNNGQSVVPRASVSAKDERYVGKSNEYQVADGNSNVAIDDEVLTWASNKVAIATVDDTGFTKAEKAGNANITAQVVNMKGKLLKATVKLKSVQAVQRLQLNKTAITVNQPKPNKTGSTSVKVSQQLPKGCTKEKINWTIKTYDANDKLITTKENCFALDKADSTGTLVNKTSAKITFTDKVAEGSYAIVTAKAANGATTTARVTMCKKTAKLEFRTNRQSTTAKITGKQKIGVGEQFMIDGKAASLDDMLVVINTAKKKSGSTVKTPEVSNAANKVAADYEKVTYTVNKKGIVTIDEDGYIYGVKVGTVKITAKTPSGKSVSLTIQVQ